MTLPASPIDLHLQEALAHEAAGRPELAEPRYRAVLQGSPRHVEANYRLGLLLGRRFQHAAALAPLKRALDEAPGKREYWLAYIAALAAAGQADNARRFLAIGRQRGLRGAEADALEAQLAAAAAPPANAASAAAQAATSANPGAEAPTPQAIQDAIALYNAGRLDQLEPVARALTQRYPNHGFGWQALGMLLKRQGRDGEALLPMQKTAELLPDDAEAHYNLGVTHKDLGNADAAAACYRRALELQPAYAEAHCNLGAILLERDLAADAEAHQRRALDGKPDFVPALVNLGNALLAQGRAAEAAASHRRALTLAADFADAHFGLGAALAVLGEQDDAIAAWSTGLALRPDHAAGHHRLGMLLGLQGRHREAEAAYRRALALRPDDGEAALALAACLGEQDRIAEAESVLRELLARQPDLAAAHYNLGIALAARGNPEAAADCYRRALALEPDAVEAANNLAGVLAGQGRLAEAEALYRRVLGQRPDLAEAHLNLAKVLAQGGRPVDAEAEYRRALALQPDHADALRDLAATLHDLGRQDEAADCYRAALRVQPDDAAARIALAMLALPQLPADDAAARAAAGAFATALDELAAWAAAGGADRRRAVAEAAGTQQPFYLAYRRGNHVALLSRYGDLIADAAREITPRIAARAPASGRRLRLAIVSHHLHRHSVWDVIVRGLLTHLDRARFELALYHLGHEEDDETVYARSRADLWRDRRSVSGTDGWLAALAEDQPDVIFYPEIGMDPLALRLAACRLAPLQAAGWGHPLTTGLPTIDLYFSGELLEPPDADAHYRERLVCLPGTGCCTSPLPIVAEPLSADTAARLAAIPGVRMLIAQLPFKFDPADDELFARAVAAAAPASLIVLEHPRAPTATARVLARLRRAFAARSLDPDRHLHVLPWQSRGQFLSLVDACDIYLDLPGFSGYTTAWQTVHRGLPVLTLAGDCLRQRLAAGLLRRIGAGDTIARSVDEYVAIAARLAEECRDPVSRAGRRQALAQASAVADHDLSAVRAFETALLAAVEAR